MLFELMAITGIGLFAAKQRTPKTKLVKKTNNEVKSAKVSPVQKKQTSRLTPFLGDVRNQQLEEFSTDAKKVGQVAKFTNRNLMIAIFSMGCVAAGNFIYAPLALLSLPGIIYTTQFAFLSGFNSLVKEGKITVDLLSATTKILFLINGYLFLASFSIFLFSLNRKLLSKITDNSKKSLINVFKQQPHSVWIVHNDVELEVPFESLKVGDIVIVNAGSSIPVDGHITRGMAAIDQHILTGESQPVDKGVGSRVFALTLVLSGKIYIQVEKTGEETTAAQIAKVLNNTINTKTDIQLWSKEISDKTVLPTFVLSGVMLPFYGATSAIAVLNSHFKYRATIASAIGVLSYLNIASHHGILIKDGRTLELLERVDTIVFDKTGTLTEEQPQVSQVYAIGEYSKNDVLRYAAAAESKQTHPIAKAILQKAKEQQLILPTIDETAYKVGYGLTVTLNERLVRVGSIRFFEQEGIELSPQIRDIQQQCHEHGHPIILVAINNQAVGAIELEASLRPGLKNVIHKLRQGNIKSVYILSGDHEAPTKKLAQELEMDHYFAEMLPEQKAQFIEELQKQGKSICYIGDGINDAIALSKASVSISLRGASTIATDAAQIILMDQDLEKIVHLFQLSQSFNKEMKTTMTMVLVPSVISVASILLIPNTHLITSFIWPQIGLTMGVVNAIKPTFTKQFTSH